MAANDYIVKILYPQECSQADPLIDHVLFAYVCISPDLHDGATVEATLYAKVQDNTTHKISSVSISGTAVACPGGSLYDAVFVFDLTKTDYLVAIDIWKIDVQVQDSDGNMVGHAAVCVGRKAPTKAAQMALAAKAAASGKPGLFHPFDVTISSPAPNGGTTTVSPTFQTLGFVDPSTAITTSHVQLTASPYTSTAGFALTNVPFPYNWGFQYSGLADGDYTLTVTAIINGQPQPSSMAITVSG